MNRRRRSAAVVASALAVLLAGVLGGTTIGTISAANHRASGEEIIAALDTLAIKGRASMTGYDRVRFGPPWADVDRNGCDTRNDMLARDMTDEVFRGSCTVLQGTLLDPYTGNTIFFVRGRESSDVQVDHVVSLGNAWATGASMITTEMRRQLANDPINLQSTYGPINQQKSDGDAATWLPPDRGYWCTFVARQVAVKARYGLWVTPAEHDRIVEIARSC